MTDNPAANPTAGLNPPSAAQISAMRQQNPFDTLMYPVYHPESPDSFYLESPLTTLVPPFQEISSDTSTNPKSQSYLLPLHSNSRSYP